MLQMTPYPCADAGALPHISSHQRLSTRFRWFAICVFALFLGGALLLIAPATASAHAEYVSSDPAMNAMLAKAPSTVTIHFSENVDPAGSNITIYDVNGKQVTPADAQVDRADLKTMQVSLSSDSSEIYVVNWHTVSAVEGHHDSGSFRFFVNISPMLKGMISGKMSMPGSTMSSSQTTPASSNGVPLWMTTLIGLIGLVVGSGITFFVTRQKTPRKALAAHTAPDEKPHS
jgi:methionine-rich copper-binding protein CopC